MSLGLRLAAGLAIPVLVLAGCSQAEAEAEPVITYPSESVEETSEAITEAWTVPPKDELYPYPKPEMPPLAQERSQQGAEAFSKYFLEAYTYAIATRDLEVLHSACGSSAPFCEANAAHIQEAIDTDTYYLNYAVSDLEITGSLRGGSTDRVEWGTQLVGFVDEHSVFVERGSEVVESGEFHFVAAVEVFWDDGWKVEDAEYVPYEDVYSE